MTIMLSKWGNSRAIRIPKPLLRQLNIDTNNANEVEFDARVEGGKLILAKKQESTKFQRMAQQAKAEPLVAEECVDWGQPVGKEVW